MIMNDSQKKDILYQSFEALKDEWAKGYSERGSIVELIASMAGLDLAIALEMWRYILQENQSHVIDNIATNNSVSMSITTDILSEIKKKCMTAELAKMLYSDDFIIKQLFNLSGCVNKEQSSIISVFINKEDFDKADRLIQLIYSNPNRVVKYNSNSFGEIIQFLINDLPKDVEDSAKHFINDWIQRIEDPKEKAKANIRFMSYVEEIDKEEKRRNFIAHLEYSSQKSKELSQKREQKREQDRLKCTEVFERIKAKYNIDKEWQKSQAEEFEMELEKLNLSEDSPYLTRWRNYIKNNFG